MSISLKKTKNLLINHNSFFFKKVTDLASGMGQKSERQKIWAGLTRTNSGLHVGSAHCHQTSRRSLQLSRVCRRQQQQEKPPSLFTQKLSIFPSPNAAFRSILLGTLPISIPQFIYNRLGAEKIMAFFVLFKVWILFFFPYVNSSSIQFSIDSIPCLPIYYLSAILPFLLILRIMSSLSFTPFQKSTLIKSKQRSESGRS